MLSAPITPQHLEPVRRRNPEIFEKGGGVEHPELPERDILDVRTKTLHSLPVEQTLGVSVSKALDHNA